MDSMKAALAAKGYDLVEQEGGESSDSDGGLPGRITALEPGLAREKGKKAFENGKYDKAIKYWQGGLKSILSSLCSGPEALSNQSLSELDLTLNLNIAMAHMKKGDYDGADRSVDKALARRDALPPHQINKALYRKASAQRAMHRLEECLETLKDMLTVEPGHAAARQMQQEVEREWSKQVREQKKNLRKLFSKMEGEDRSAEVKRLAARTEARKACAVKWTENDVDTDAFDQGDTPSCDGQDWGLALSRTTLWSVEQLAVEGGFSLPRAAETATFWFLGASSTCELRHLQPQALMARLPAVRTLELVMIGFLGEMDPDNKRVPDPKADSLPRVPMESNAGDGRKAVVRLVPGTLEEALAKELALVQKGGEAGGAELAASSGEDHGDVATTAAPGEAPESGVAPKAAPDNASGGGAGAAEGKAPQDVPPPKVPPDVCFVAHPQLHRYFTQFFPAISWLIEHKVPTIVIGASEPDLSWKQDEILLKALGANLVVGKRECPYPMCLPDNPKIRKCNHIIGFEGGKPVAKEKLTKLKLDLLAQDYTVR